MYFLRRDLNSEKLFTEARDDGRGEQEWTLTTSNNNLTTGWSKIVRVDAWRFGKHIIRGRRQQVIFIIKYKATKNIATNDSVFTTTLVSNYFSALNFDSDLLSLSIPYFCMALLFLILLKFIQMLQRLCLRVPFLIKGHQSFSYCPPHAQPFQSLKIDNIYMTSIKTLFNLKCHEQRLSVTVIMILKCLIEMLEVRQQVFKTVKSLSREPVNGSRTPAWWMVVLRLFLIWFMTRSAVSGRTCIALASGRTGSISSLTPMPGEF